MFFRRPIRVDNYPRFRKKVYDKRLGELAEDPVQLSLDGIDRNVKGRCDLKVDHTVFECFITPGDDKSLVVFLSAGGRGAKASTKFDRVTWHRWTEATCISIEDPMYKKYPSLKEGWYFGDKGVSYIDQVALIVGRICQQRGISSKDVVVIGSSAGGTAALALANIVPESTAVAFNPQIYLDKWRPVEEFALATGLELSSPELSGRSSIVGIRENKRSRFILTFNSACDVDLERQLKPFLPNTEFDIGLNSFGNISVIVGRYSYFKPHNVFLSPHETSIVVNVLSSMLPEVVKKNIIANITEEVNSKYNQLEKEFFSDLWETISAETNACLKLKSKKSLHSRQYEIAGALPIYRCDLTLDKSGMKRVTISISREIDSGSAKCWSYEKFIVEHFEMQYVSDASRWHITGTFDLERAISAISEIAALVRSVLGSDLRK